MASNEAASDFFAEISSSTQLPTPGTEKKRAVCKIYALPVRKRWLGIGSGFGVLLSLPFSDFYVLLQCLSGILTFNKSDNGFQHQEISADSTDDKIKLHKQGMKAGTVMY
ncbi:hypothetical protein BaRGS_00024251 [Batillaria attramentaria]|uniref:Uncharacterized protein n=1 Tax=Batillaria attramentaria TaxID=370345 RepID=A0ABD0KBM0_9CAEN